MHVCVYVIFPKLLSNTYRSYVRKLPVEPNILSELQHYRYISMEDKILSRVLLNYCWKSEEPDMWQLN